MADDLRDMEAKALAAQKADNFADAITTWNTILMIQPNWEGGYACYYLADCYTRVGQIDLAIEAYRRAIAIAPEDTMFSEALESLLEARKLGHI